MNKHEISNTNEEQHASIHDQNDYHLETDSDNDIDYDEDFDAVRSMN